MDHVPQLLLSEFKQARHLLYDELIVGARSLPRMRPWALKDNLDADAFGWFFGQHRENTELLKPFDEVFADCYPRLEAAAEFFPE